MGVKCVSLYHKPRKMTQTLFNTALMIGLTVFVGCYMGNKVEDYVLFSAGVAFSVLLLLESVKSLGNHFLKQRMSKYNHLLHGKDNC